MIWPESPHIGRLLRMAFSDRTWCPEGPPPIPNHGGLGERKVRIGDVKTPDGHIDPTASYEQAVKSTIKISIALFFSQHILFHWLNLLLLPITSTINNVA